ncbi:MFS general substrate transporter [Schizopora paradoxa]|uniref:MFS general substrate transporter n=1 Tax=Schizopora paradoxa TaxID=27342 RepID=A0A0H2RXN3_9AGAM|nr:MFS general substrate transporter [Schizopora paradoxa]
MITDIVQAVDEKQSCSPPVSPKSSDRDFSATSTRLPMDLSETKKVDENLQPTGEETQEATLEAVPSEELEPRDSKRVKARAFSTLRRYLLLLFFCLAQFLDIFNLSALYSANPTIAADLNMTGSESVWTISAVQLTFASFLLISGRISDIYNAKWAFIVGLACLGLLDLGMGRVKNKIGFFVLRAIGGIFSSLTIPSAMHLIVKLFPEPSEQSKAIAVFGATGAVATSLGVVIGAVLVQKASWHWIFYLVTIAAIAIAIASIFLIPSKKTLQTREEPKRTNAEKLKQLDIAGVAILTTALVLLVYSLTQGANKKWADGGVLAPLIISIFLIAGFLYYETLLPEDMVSVPPSTWFLPNFSVLFGTAMLPYFWWTTVFIVYLQYWQQIFLWSPINAAVHVLPAGIVTILMAPTGPLQNKISPKWIILFGEVFAFIGTILFPFSGGKNHYWSRVFPGFVIGSSGMMLVFVHSNIAMFRTTPSKMAGVVGALFNSALQIGSAVGFAAVTSISTSIEKKDGPDGVADFRGRADAFWFLFAMVSVATIGCVVFYKPDRIAEVEVSEKGIEKSDEEKASK